MILKFTQKNVKTGNISGTVKELRSQRDKMVTFSAEGGGGRSKIIRTTNKLNCNLTLPGFILIKFVRETFRK